MKAILLWLSILKHLNAIPHSPKDISEIGKNPKDTEKDSSTSNIAGHEQQLFQPPSVIPGDVLSSIDQIDGSAGSNDLCNETNCTNSTPVITIKN